MPEGGRDPTLFSVLTKALSERPHDAIFQFDERSIRPNGTVRNIDKLTGAELLARAAALVSGLLSYRRTGEPPSSSLVVIYGSHQGIPYQTLYLACTLAAVNTVLVPTYHTMSELADTLRTVPAGWRRSVSFFVSGAHAQVACELPRLAARQQVVSFGDAAPTRCNYSTETYNQLASRKAPPSSQLASRWSGGGAGGGARGGGDGGGGQEVSSHLIVPRQGDKSQLSLVFVPWNRITQTLPTGSHGRAPTPMPIAPTLHPSFSLDNVELFFNIVTRTANPLFTLGWARSEPLIRALRPGILRGTPAARTLHYGISHATFSL